MRSFTIRLLPALVAASLLAACSGGGTGTTSALPNLAPQGGAFTPTGMFTAVGDAPQAIAYLPTVDVFTASGGSVGNRLAPMGHGSTSSGGNLNYGGGPIQAAPKMYVVYWGSAWNGSGDPDGMKAQLNNFLGHVGGTSWNNTVTQYYQTNPSANAGNPANNFGGSYVDTSSSPPKSPSQSQMAAEAVKAAAHFGDYSVGAQYVVAMPHGISPSGFKRSYCAYHSSTTANGSTISWTNLPYLPDAGSGCGANSVSGVLDGVSIVEGHEMAEAETDPHPSSGWTDSSGAEIGDKCAWVNLQETSLNGVNFPTQPLWSNKTSSCVQSY